MRSSVKKRTGSQTICSVVTWIDDVVKHIDQSLKHKDVLVQLVSSPSGPSNAGPLRMRQTIFQRASVPVERCDPMVSPS